MTRYWLVSSTADIRKREEIAPGCTVSRDESPEIIETFDSKRAALKALDGCTTEVLKLSDAVGTFYAVAEWYVQEVEEDKDGEFVGGGDIWAFSKMGGIE